MQFLRFYVNINTIILFGSLIKVKKSFKYITKYELLTNISIFYKIKL